MRQRRLMCSVRRVTELENTKGALRMGNCQGLLRILQA